eukprot:1335361-Alexandrium_andersonii.AAC.1
MLGTQLQGTAPERACTPRAENACLRARACEARRARHATGTKGFGMFSAISQHADSQHAAGNVP